MLGKYSRSKFVSLAVFVLLVSTLPLLSFHSSAESSSTAGIVIPLYTYPTDGTWNTVAQMKEEYPNVPIMAVINPDSGPGTSFDQNYANGIQLLQSAGVIVLGYVDTADTADSISSVESNVNLYHEWYPTLNGIMFDDMSNAPSTASYYATLGSYAESLGYTVTMGNAGTSVPSNLVGTLDILCIQENAGLVSASALSSAAMGNPASDFAYIAYATSMPSESYLASVAADAQWIYVTDATLPNPYDVLPSYFSSLVATMSQIDDPAVAPVTVDSAYENGSSFSGMWTTVESGGSLVASGFTPLQFSAAVGLQYTVTVDNYQNYEFTNWENGGTNASLTIYPAQATTLTAYYSTGPTYVPLTVESADLSGNQFSGMWTVIATGDQVVDSGFTPLVYNATAGVTYSVAVANYEGYIFSSWQGGATNSNVTVTPSQATTLLAYYSTPASTATSSQLTSTTTILSTSTSSAKAAATATSTASSSATTTSRTARHHKAVTSDSAALPFAGLVFASLVGTIATSALLFRYSGKLTSRLRR